MKPPTSKGSLHQLLSGRSSSDGQPNKSNSLGRNVASFEAKFAAVSPVQSDVGLGVVGGRGQVSTSSASGVSLSGGSSSHGSVSDEADHSLTANWKILWETRLQRREFSFLHCIYLNCYIYLVASGPNSGPFPFSDSQCCLLKY